MTLVDNLLKYKNVSILNQIYISAPYCTPTESVQTELKKNSNNNTGLNKQSSHNKQPWMAI